MKAQVIPGRPGRPAAGSRRSGSLCDLRTRRGLTLSEVARAMGTDTGHVSRFENGKYEVAEAFIMRWAEAVGVTPARARRAYWTGVRDYARSRAAEALAALGAGSGGAATALPQ